jgi:hypothetical protein
MALAQGSAANIGAAIKAFVNERFFLSMLSPFICLFVKTVECRLTHKTVWSFTLKRVLFLASFFAGNTQTYHSFAG